MKHRGSLATPLQRPATAFGGAAAPHVSRGGSAPPGPTSPRSSGRRGRAKRLTSFARPRALAAGALQQWAGGLEQSSPLSSMRSPRTPAPDPDERIQKEVSRFQELQHKVRYIGGDPEGADLEDQPKLDEPIVLRTVAEPAKYQFKYTEAPHKSSMEVIAHSTPAQLVANAVRRCSVRRAIPEELRNEPDFRKEKYISYLMDPEKQGRYQLLGAKAEANELLNRNERHADDAARRLLEDDIANWIGRITAAEEGAEDLGGRHLEQAQEDSEALRGKDTVTDRSHQMIVAAHHIDDITNQAFQMLRAKAKQDAGLSRLAAMRSSKKTQTTITLLVHGGGGAGIDSPESEAAPAPGSEGESDDEGAIALKQALNLDEVTRRKNAHITKALGTCEALRCQQKEKTVLFKAEILLREVAMKRAEAEVRILSTGAGFTSQWEKGSGGGDMPEIDVQGLMDSLREEVRQHSEEDKRRIREQQAEIEQLRADLEFTKGECERKLHIMEATLRDVKRDRDELRKELTELEEIISWRDDKIKIQEGALDAVADELQSARQERDEAVGRMREVQIEMAALTDRLKLMITREEHEEKLAEQIRRSELVKKLKDAELHTHRRKNMEMEQQLERRNAEIREAQSQAQELQGELVTAREQVQTVGALFTRNICELLRYIEEIRLACSDLDNQQFRPHVWEQTELALDHLSEGASNKRSHLHSPQLERILRRQFDMAYECPAEPLLEIISNLESQVEGLQEQSARLPEVEQALQMEERLRAAEKGFFKAYCRSGLRCIQLLCELTRESEVKGARIIEYQTVLADSPEDLQRHIHESWKGEITLLADAFHEVHKLKSGVLGAASEMQRVLRQLRHAQYASDFSALGVAKMQKAYEVGQRAVETLREHCGVMRREVIAPAVDFIDPAAAALPTPQLSELQLLVSEGRKLATRSMQLAFHRCKNAVRRKARQRRILGRRPSVKAGQRLSADAKEELRMQDERLAREAHAGNLASLARAVFLTAETAAIGSKRLDNLVRTASVIQSILTAEVAELRERISETDSAREQERAKYELRISQLRDRLDNVQEAGEQRDAELEEHERAVAALRSQLSELSDQRERELQQAALERAQLADTVQQLRAQGQQLQHQLQQQQQQQQQQASPRSPGSPAPPGKRQAPGRKKPGGRRPDEIEVATPRSGTGELTLSADLQAAAAKLSEKEEQWRAELVRRIHTLERSLGLPLTDPHSLHPDVTKATPASAVPSSALMTPQSMPSLPPSPGLRRRPPTAPRESQTEDSELLQVFYDELEERGVESVLKALMARPATTAERANTERAFDPRKELLERVQGSPSRAGRASVPGGTDSPDTRASPPARMSPDSGSRRPFQTRHPTELQPRPLSGGRPPQPRVPRSDRACQTDPPPPTRRSPSPVAVARRSLSQRRERPPELRHPDDYRPGCPDPYDPLSPQLETRAERLGGWIAQRQVDAARGALPLSMLVSEHSRQRLPNAGLGVGLRPNSAGPSPISALALHKLEAAKQRAADLLDSARSRPSRPSSGRAAGVSEQLLNSAAAEGIPTRVVASAHRRGRRAGPCAATPGAFRPGAKGSGESELDRRRKEVLALAFAEGQKASEQPYPALPARPHSAGAAPAIVNWLTDPSEDWNLLQGPNLPRTFAPGTTCRMLTLGRGPDGPSGVYAVVATVDWGSGLVVLRVSHRQATMPAPWTGGGSPLRSLPVPGGEPVPSPSSWRLTDQFHQAVGRYTRNATELLALRGAANPETPKGGTPAPPAAAGAPPAAAEARPAADAAGSPGPSTPQGARPAELLRLPRVSFPPQFVMAAPSRSRPGPGLPIEVVLQQQREAAESGSMRAWRRPRSGTVHSPRPAELYHDPPQPRVPLAPLLAAARGAADRADKQLQELSPAPSPARVTRRQVLP
eukprot:TRINITY_DN8291_c7_g1_i1.p1 TRINITY_DN8291_c7_g1~~TRINITY_DN8291_c7_g1_i1.p1  ORF type:complete len:1940 (+),score=636.76 TRINITY_DN8291_c7_g1_i1:76-5820(+)